jgi:hypothetical protein
VFGLRNGCKEDYARVGTDFIQWLGGVFDILIIDGIEWCLLCSVGNMKELERW